jgi:hypothetical protein
MKVYKILFMAWAAVCLCACDSTADKIAGSWESNNFLAPADDGTKSDQSLSYVFTKNDGEEGGSMVEDTYFTMNEEVEGYKYVAKYTSTINGTWKIKDDEMYITYDLNTIKIKINKLESKDEKVNAILQTMLNNPELQQNVKNEMRDEYIKENKEADTGYPIMSIEPNEMKWKTGDVGTITFRKK